MCPSKCMSMAAVHHDGAVADMGMTILRYVGVWDTAGQERMDRRQSSGGGWGVKWCFESGCPLELNTLQQEWQMCITMVL